MATAPDEKTMEEWSEDLQAVVGKSWPGPTMEVTTTSIRMFARALGYSEPHFYNIRTAQAKGYPSLLAPPGFMGFAVYDPNQDAEQPSPWPTFARSLNGGRAFDVIEPVFAGDVLTSVRTAKSVVTRQSRMGTLLIRVSETLYTRESDGKVVGRRRDTSINY